MHRPTSLFGQRDIFCPKPQIQPRETGLFNFRPQFRSNPDYFNIKPVHGSSPAGSLAADLSQNFRIEDASPSFPTPRRSLFTANVMAAAEGRDYATTPPLPPTSSPGMLDEIMDMSPLPHKAPYVAQIEIQSPTPLQSPADDEMMLESPLPQHSSSELLKPAVVERRKPVLRRPSLTRAKGYSTGGMSARLQPDSQLPFFKFGGESRLAPPSNLSLGECFEDSPPQERRPQTANSPSLNAPGAVRPRPNFASLSSASASRNGSPVSNHARRPSNPFARPRKQYRRSLSMFENPVDMIKPKKDESSPPILAAVMDIEEPREPVLPHFLPDDPTDSIPRIDRSTLLEVLDGKYNEHFDSKLVIDCRFEYEYEGGHIGSAINYNDKDLLTSHLFRTPMEGRTLLIFHCEYSAHRAPLMARHIRAQDRAANAECYPRLTYPDVYILEGGYSGFFAEHASRCEPQAYVEMDAAEHAFTCEREMGRLRQNRKGLSRAATFACGQTDRYMNDSPTAPGRGQTREDISMMVGASPILGSERCHARRMASY